MDGFFMGRVWLLILFLGSGLLLIIFCFFVLVRDVGGFVDVLFVFM